MNITTYTSYNEIRYVIGLSVKELTDDQLGSTIYENTLSLAIASVAVPETVGSGTFREEFSTISNTAEATRTTSQQKFYDLARLFATYVVADAVCKTLPMTAPKMLSDSKASLTRFSAESTYKDVVAAIKDMVASIKQEIENIGSTTAVVLPYLAVLKPETDPVLGE